MSKPSMIASFRFQIALWTLTLSGLLTIGVMLSAYLMVRQQKIEVLDAQLKAFTNRLPGNPGGRTGMQRLEQARQWIFGEDTVHLSIRDQNGASVFKSPDWPTTIPLPEAPASPQSLSEPDQPDASPDREFGRGRPQGAGSGRQLYDTAAMHFETLRSDRERWRLGLLTTRDHEYRILVSLNRVDADLAALRWRLATILLPALIALAGGAWLIAGRAIRPLNNISAAAEKVVGGHFSERIEPAERAPEIDRIIRLLNRMLDRLEANYRQALRFSADASHELKTPITLMQNTLIQHLNSVEADGPQARFCSELLEHLSRIKRLTEGLLLLARADSGELPRSPQSFDVAELCRELCDDLRSLAEMEDAAVSGWEATIPPSLPVVADPFFVRTILFNLLLNAVRYSGQPPRIEAALSLTGGTVRFAVTNNGSAIPAGEQEAIFSRFYRGANATGTRVKPSGQDSGNGLGLAIAREMATVLGGQLVLRHSQPESTCFEFSWPQSPSAIGQL